MVWGQASARPAYRRAPATASNIFITAGTSHHILSCMSIPDFQALMLPLLRLMADGAEHRIRDLIPALADEFNLTEDERRELLPSGRQARFDNRVHWAASYLKEARLV